jgi:hypothetical protein
MRAETWELLNTRPVGPSVGKGLPLWSTGGPPGTAPAADGLVDIHPALEQVRRMPEFQPPPPGWLDHLEKWPWVQALSRQVEDLLQTLTNALAQWLSQLSLPGGAAQLPVHIREAFQALLAFLLLIAALYVVYVLSGLLLRGMDGWSRRRRPDERTAHSLSSSACLAQARHWAEQGRYDEAIRQLYLAALSLLDERKLVPFEESRSDREYRAALSRRPGWNDGSSALPPFARLADAFEAVRYGQKPGALPIFQRCEESYGELRDRVE